MNLLVEISTLKESAILLTHRGKDNKRKINDYLILMVTEYA